jgi:hypothetical protein
MLALFFIGLGILSLYLSIRSLLDPAFSRKYVETNPKAWLGRKLFGGKASSLNRRLFLPLGIILGICFILVGAMILLT